MFRVQRGGCDCVLARYSDDVLAKLCNAGRRLESANQGTDDFWIALRRSLKPLEGRRTMLEVRGYSSRPRPARLSAEEIKKMLALGVPLKVCTIYAEESSTLLTWRRYSATSSRMNWVPYRASQPIATKRSAM